MNLGQQITLQKKEVHRLKQRNEFFEKRPFILGKESADNELRRSKSLPADHCRPILE